MLLFSNSVLAKEAVQRGEVTAKVTKAIRVTKFVKGIKEPVLAIADSKVCEGGLANAREIKSGEGFTSITAAMLIIYGAVMMHIVNRAICVGGENQ